MKFVTHCNEKSGSARLDFEQSSGAHGVLGDAAVR